MIKRFLLVVLVVAVFVFGGPVYNVLVGKSEAPRSVEEGLERIGVDTSRWNVAEGPCPELTLPSCTVSLYHPGGIPWFYSCKFDSTDFGNGFVAQFAHSPDNVVWCEKGTSEGQNANYCYADGKSYKSEVTVIKQEILADGTIGQKQQHALCLIIDLRDGHIVEWWCCNTQD